MKIGYSRDKIIDLLLQGRKNVFNIVIIVFTLISALIIYKNQNQKIGLLNSRKGAELKKNEVLTEIARSEKRINSYKNLFSRKDAASVTNALNNIAKNSNIRLVSLRPGVEQNLPLYIRQPYILVIEADNYHAIGKFISKIENQPDMYFVDAISIKLREGQGLIVNVTLSIIVFKG